MADDIPEIKISRELKSFLEGNGLTFEGTARNAIVRIRPSDGNSQSTSPYGRRRWGIPANQLENLETQFVLNPRAVDAFYGLSTPDGHVEFPIRTSIGNGLFRPLRHLEGSLAKATVAPGRAMDPRVSLTPISREARNSGEFLDGFSEIISDGDQESPSVHVFDPVKNVSIEISRQSAVGIVFGPPNLSPGRDAINVNFSIKICLSPSGDPGSDLEAALNYAHSFLYEISLRNGIYARLIPRGDRRVIKRNFRDSAGLTEVRFPQTKVNGEVAQLYAYAHDSSENNPVAFLSFYQIVEYFYPRAMRDSIITHVRREIQNTSFSASSDADILRVVLASEASGIAKEIEQLKVTLSLAVRPHVLEEFFEPTEVREYFSKKGPISGVGIINLGNRGEALDSQVAQRVYALRNRIVHAKDDPKYSAEEKKLLLPMGGEARQMDWDVRLMCLLAEEAISFFQ